MSIHFTVHMFTLDMHLIMRILYVHETALHNACIALDIRHLL